MILDRYLAKQFFPVFFAAAVMFVLLLSMIELFTYLVRFLSNGVSAQNIMMVSLYYLPKSFSFAMPISLLFAAAYTLGDLYARNELTVVFSSGIPFWRFSFGLLVIGILASAFSFFFDDIVVIPTYKMKTDLTRFLLNELPKDEEGTDIVIRTRGGNLTYAVDYFDHQKEILNGLSIIEQDLDGRFVYMIRARSAAWTGEHWELNNAVIYEWQDGFLLSRNMENAYEFRESPDTFRRGMVNVGELNFMDARFLVDDLRNAGLPFVHVLADFYHRFSFAAVSFVVMFLSVSMGGRFRKNIVLMSLVSSLVSAAAFYIIEMISMLMAQTGLVNPFIGAWFPVFVFTIAGLILLRTAKT